MRILLADPPHLIWDMMKGWVPNPALLALSAYLENEFETHVMDCTVMPDPWGDLEREVVEFKPNIVGLCCIGTTYLYDSLNAARLVKMVSPQTKVIIGGTHPTLAPEEVLTLGPEVDFCCIGEGEETLAEFIRTVSGGERDFSNVKGLAFRDGSSVIKTEARPFIENLDTLPIPAYHRVPMDSPLYTIDVIGPKCVVPSFSRGCGFKCTFCTETLRWGNRWRGKSAWKIVEEIELLQKNYGIKTFLLGDNDFLWSRQRNLEYCELMEKKGLKANLWIQARPDHIMRDRDLIPRFRKVGLFEVLVGIESFDQSMMDKWEKREELETIVNCIALLKKNGIMVLTSLMFGHWNDRKESLDSLIKSAIKYSDFMGLGIATPFPGTQFYKEAKVQGRIE
ncbi:MAG: B12-binding domain-containing radical SAM protein, partial [Nitrospirota bacterium]